MHMLKQFFLSALFFFCTLSVFSQDFDTKINTTAQELAKKITSTNKQKVAIVEFDNTDNIQTQLGVFLADEISTSLANLTENQSKFRVLDRANLDLILEEKKVLKSFDRSKLAKDLGKIDAADILICGTITDFNGYYRVNIKLLDTKTGDALSGTKINFVKEPSLEQLFKETIKKQPTAEDYIVKPKQIEQKPAYTAPITTTEVCFNNVSYSYSAIVILKNPNTGEKVKSVDVLNGQKGCVYNIPNGVYQIEVSWFYWSEKGRINRTDSREINVKADTPNSFQLQY